MNSALIKEKSWTHLSHSDFRAALKLQRSLRVVVYQGHNTLVEKFIKRTG